VLTGSIDNTVRPWDAAAGNEIRAFKGHENIVTSVVFSPDGAQVLTGAWDEIARLWDAATGKATRAETFRQHRHRHPPLAKKLTRDRELGEVIRAKADITVETIGRIRGEHFIKGKTIKEIVRDLKVSRNTVRKVLRSGATSFEYERDVQPRPKLGRRTTDLENALY
jgi:WD domain, G-beta repeat